MYAEKQSEPVDVDRTRLNRLAPHIEVEHLNLEGDSLARHDPERLVRAIFHTENLPEGWAQ
jgi:hypothetical protein